MDWYYAEGQQQRGPVSETGLADLVRSGTVKDDTLVWREGLANWQPYREVKAAERSGAASPRIGGAMVCSQCGGSFPPDEVIRYGDFWVCAGCKPAFVQRLKEGAAMPGAREFAGFWIRLVAKFVDGLVMRFVGAFVGAVAGAALSGLGASNRRLGLALIYGLAFCIDILYRTIFVGAYGATPGKMAVKIRIVNADGSKVGYAKAFARSLAEILSVVTLLLGYIMAAFDSEKRTLHDRICGTRVMKKLS